MAALKLYFCLFGCLWSYAVAQSPAIITGPVRQLVPFNLDAMATFTCAVSGQQLIWQINSAQLVTDADKEAARDIGIFPDVTDNMDGTMSGTLRINVSESNTVNMTLVGCLAVGASTLDRVVSDFVSLITFGIPEAPLNFELTPSNAPGTLTIRWDPPTNTPPDVLTTHDVVVVNMATREPYPGFPQNNLMLDMTILTFDEQNTNCTPFDFEVTATNAAGTSNSSVLTETIPISPDVTPINEGLTFVVTFSGSEVSILVTFPRAQTCSETSFPVMQHIVNIEIAESPAPVSTADSSDILEVSLGPTGLVMNTVYTISVTASSRIISRTSNPFQVFYTISVAASSGVTRRTSDPFRVFTTDVQTATVDFIETDNRVFLTCTFAVGSTAQGCVFIFTLRNETEMFMVMREPGTLCTTSINNAGSFDTVQVVDWESDGNPGVFTRTIEPTLILDERSFSRTCPLPDDGLSGGQIAGIVIGIVAAVLLVAAIVVVVIVVYFTTRRNTEYGEEGDKIWINLPGAHMSRVARPGMHEEPESDDEPEVERGETSPLAGAPPPPPPSDAIQGGEPFDESTVRLLSAQPKPEPSAIPMETIREDPGSEEKRPPIVHVDSVSADMGTTVSPGSPPTSLFPTTATVEPTKSYAGGPMSTLRSIDSTTGTSTRPRQVGELDLSNSKNMKIRLNPRVVRKVLNRRSANQDDEKKLLLYCE